MLNGIENSSEETMSDEKKQEVYRILADAQLKAWENGHGYCYWSYKLLTDTVNSKGWIGWDAWDLGRSYDFGWFPKQ